MPLKKKFTKLEFDSISNESKTFVKFFGVSVGRCNVQNKNSEAPLLSDTKEVANILLGYDFYKVLSKQFLNILCFITIVRNPIKISPLKREYEKDVTLWVGSSK